ncbi:MAG: efflux RND transporter periplasmic adaptor subunit, partial [bacterium]
MKTAFKIVGIVFAFILLGSVMAYLAGFFETKIPVDFKGVIPSADNGQVFTIEVKTEPLMETAAGTIRAKVETVISSLITASISSISVRAGDEVKKGDILVELDSRELKARVAQARQSTVAIGAGLKRIEKDFNRVQRILKADSGAISKAELDRTQAALETARAELIRARRQEDETKTALSYSTLSAPISGRVVERYADPGDTSRQGEPILRMYDPGTLRLEANVRESIASRLKKGQHLTARIDAINRQLTTVVEEIVPSAEPGSRTFLAKVKLAGNAGLYPGMFGRLLIPIGETEKIYIPEKAVTRVGQLDFVIVKTEKGPVRRYVRVGATGSN